MAADLEPPRRVFAHGWWTNEGEKISKSLGNVIDPIELVESYGLDQVRYFMMREVPFGNDGDFSHAAIVNRMNAELANDLGNLVQRVLSMVYKNCDERVPEIDHDGFSAEDQKLLDQAHAMLDTVRQQLDRQTFHEALETIWLVIRAANTYVDHQAPWKLRKEDPQRMAYVLYSLSETIRYLGLILQPFMPTSCNQILDQLCIAQDERDFQAFNAKYAVKGGTLLPKPEGIFPRYVDGEAANKAS
jgi:methionyl-tRNA synthetase